MCIRDRRKAAHAFNDAGSHEAGVRDALAAAEGLRQAANLVCLLYTSDAADERSSVDLGGRRIIKKKHTYVLSRTLEILVE